LWEILVKHAKINKQYLKILHLIQAAQRQDTKLSVTEIVFRFIENSDYIKDYLEEDSIENQLKVQNINLFFDKLKAYDRNYPNTSIADCIDYFDLLIEAGENPAQAEIEDVDTVNLLTVHSSKGLEWPIVFVVNLVADRFPTRNRKDSIELPDDFVKQKTPQGNAHIQEERRLFYVAQTRAKDFLFLVYGKNYGGRGAKKPSPLLKELELNTNSIAKPQTEQLSLIKLPSGVESPNKYSDTGSEIRLTNISHSQIETYKTCPLKYKYQYILRVPTKPTHALSFGTTIHNTLQKFHNFQIQGQDPSLDVLWHIYDSQFQGIGYDSKAHKEKRYQEGKKALENYYHTHQEIFSGSPRDLEKSFKLKIDGVTLTGRIDRIDSLRGDSQIELIDYKTGKAREQKAVDKDPQLTIYAMASEVLFGVIPENLSLFFVSDSVKVTTTRTKKDIEKKKQDIAKVIAQIKKGEFKAKPGFHCRFCPYNEVCPSAMR
jgi:DNA helicase-2/ATP-dependent DNA helicase PcrA